MGLTPKQKAVLEYIQHFSKAKGYCPSQQEIADHFEFSSLGTVQNYLVRLERQGFLRKAWNSKRALEVVPAAATTPSSPSNLRNSLILKADGKEAGTVPLPILGKVAAGKPIEYVEPDSSLDIPTAMLRGPNPLDDHFVLRVSGDSMIGDGILDGDYVVIQKRAQADAGQTVVAMIGSEATIKRYYRHGKSIELRAANPAYEPILLHSLTETRDFRIEGVLVGVIRKLA